MLRHQPEIFEKPKSQPLPAETFQLLERMSGEIQRYLLTLFLPKKLPTQHTRKNLITGRKTTTTGTVEGVKLLGVPDTY